MPRVASAFSQSFVKKQVRSFLTFGFDPCQVATLPRKNRPLPMGNRSEFVIGMASPEGKAAGLIRESVLVRLFQAPIDGDRVDQVLGTL